MTIDSIIQILEIYAAENEGCHISLNIHDADADVMREVGGDRTRHGSHGAVWDCVCRRYRNEVEVVAYSVTRPLPSLEPDTDATVAEADEVLG